MSSFSFPATPMSFASVSTQSRTRIFLLTPRSPWEPPELSQVTTISETPDLADRLISSLNRAAWSGDRDALDAVLATLPDAVAKACLDALSQCPAPSEVALGFDDAPMTVLREISFGDDLTELAIQARAATDVGLQFLIQNVVDDLGTLGFEAKLLSDDHEVSSGDVGSWWPVPQGVELLERLHPEPESLEDALRDPRWNTHAGRAYWLWIANSEDASDGVATATWVVEFTDAPVKRRDSE